MNDPRYDINLTTGATTYGFMLVTPPQKPKQLMVEEVADPDSLWLLRRLQTTETQTHQDFDPKEDTPFAQGDLSGGAGQMVFNSKADETRYWWSSGIVTHVSGKAFLAPPTTTLSPGLPAAPAGFYSYQSPSTGVRYDFLWASTGLYRRNASNDSNTWSLVYTAEAAITDFAVFNGVGLIAYPSGTVTSYATQSDVTAAPTWTVTTHTFNPPFPTGNKPKFWAGVRSTAYAAVDSNKVYYTTDPTTNGWIGPIAVGTPKTNFSGSPGDATYPIQSIIPVNDFLFVFKYDGGWSIDANQETNETIWMWRQQPSVTNFPNTASADALLYYTVANEVYAYDPANGRNYPLNLSRQDGFSIVSIVGMSALGQSVYTLATVRVPHLRSGNSTALIVSTRTSPTTWTSEVLWEDTSATTYASLGVVPNGNGARVYWSATGSTTIHMDIPAQWDGSTTGSFASAGSLYLSQVPTGFPNFVKRHLWVGTYTDSLSSSNTITIQYSLDNGVTWTSLATLNNVGNNGLNLSQFSGIDSQSIVLRFDFAGPGTTTPTLRVIDLHDRVRFRYLRKVTAAVRLADYVELRNGTKDTQTAANMLANIQTLRATDAQITYSDFLGNSFPVSVDTVTYQPTLDEGAESKYEMQAVLILPEAALGS